MPRMRLLPTTAATVSNPFNVRGDENLSVVASGLAGVEEAVVQIYDGVDFVDLTDASATMTATEPSTQITAGGLYRIRKDATVGEAGVVVG